MPTSTASLCRVCRGSDFDDPALAERMQEILGTPAARVHRKAWESALAVEALERGGVLTDNSVGASVGAGHEAVLYHLANRCGRVFACDLYGEGTWADVEGSADMLRDPDLFAPYPYRRGRLVVCHMDALDLRFEDAGLDWVVSLGSIEHFGGVVAARRCLAEVARVLRPGGIAAVATELAVDGRGHHSQPGFELFDAVSIAALARCDPRLALLDPLDLTPAGDDPPPVQMAGVMDRQALGTDVARHVRLRLPDGDGGREFTSVMLAFERVS